MDTHALNTVSQRKGIINVPRDNESVCLGGFQLNVTQTAHLGRRKGPATLAVIRMVTKFAAQDGTDPDVLPIVLHVTTTSMDITLVTLVGIKFAYLDGMGPSVF